ncbi:type IV pilus modification protein PilV [Polaromonas sp.]|uniref:type IV pilus modification protein PilV n=1 Tax=Polaromonas sp. TaxID=1869339 RepID=UPI0035662970
MHLGIVRSRVLTRHRWRLDRGGSLIEVLVSIVIASIALLALAGVNASALRYTKMSQYRATATLLASDLGERMRANKGLETAGGVAATGFFAGVYDYSSTDFAGQATAATLPAELCNTAASSCTQQQVADLDMAQWRLLVRTQLPEGSIFISRQSGQTAADVWVAWRDPAVANNDEAPALASECPDGLNLNADLSVRCSFFRINL